MDPRTYRNPIGPKILGDSFKPEMSWMDLGGTVRFLPQQYPWRIHVIGIFTYIYRKKMYREHMYTLLLDDMQHESGPWLVEGFFLGR